MKKLVIILSFILSGLLMYGCSSGHIYSSSRPYPREYYYYNNNYPVNPYYYGPPVYHHDFGNHHDIHHNDHGWVDGHH